MFETRILFVDDDPVICRQVKEYLEGEPPTVQGGRLRVVGLTDFDAALERLEAERFDLAVLDVRREPQSGTPEDMEAGVKTLAAIKQRRFVPVIFYTGVPLIVADLQSPFVRVVEKTRGLTALATTVEEILATRLPEVNRALLRHIEEVQRDYMWNFVAQYWQQLGNANDRTALAYLLARRLASSLSGLGIQRLMEELGGTAWVAAEGRVHPMQYYVMPRVEQQDPRAGDIYLGRLGDDEGYWLLLTPSCDMVGGREKADRVLFARCRPLTERPEYHAWSASRSSTNLGRLRRLLGNNAEKQPERYYFLPGALDLPDLVVDYEHTVSRPRADLASLEDVATLDSPFAEAALARFSRHYGRLGTPDLDVETVVSNHGRPADPGDGSTMVQ